LTTILRGFKLPLTVLNRFLEANGLELLEGDRPAFASDYRNLDEVSQLLRAKVGVDDTKTRLFIPYRMPHPKSDFAYVAYDWVMVYAQREVDLADEAPPGFANLRDEIMAFANESDAEQLRLMGQGRVDAMFVIVNDEERIRFVEPYLRKVSCGSTVAVTLVVFGCLELRANVSACSPIFAAKCAAWPPHRGSASWSTGRSHMDASIRERRDICPGIFSKHSRGHGQKSVLACTWRERNHVQYIPSLLSPYVQFSSGKSSICCCL
jgi:hypothetical protein